MIMRLLRLCFLLALLLLTAINSAQTFPAPGGYTATDTINGQERLYRIYIPKTYPDATAPVPLVLMLHGASGTAEGIEAITNLNELADQEGFVVVYPEGVDLTWRDDRQPNDPIDDVAFISTLIDDMTSRLSIDPTRVYIAGFSAGGMMAFRVGCELQDKITAVGVIATTLPRYLFDNCQNASPIPVLIIHGTNDPIVFWEGSIGYMSLVETLNFWVERNQCDPAIGITGELDAVPDDITAVRLIQFNACAEGTEVSVYSVLGGGHTYPGHPIIAPGLELGNTSQEFDANEALWQFFARHPLPEGAATAEPIAFPEPVVTPEATLEATPETTPEGG
ncbi:MAG: alpha/beta hydrolase fold domain-containing protein [Anaerolineae bacterium]|jgi:polyhydroxybutyrate depolymerase|nr:alpha/beta hydrolase fold domain-containing protein [Anaerolineae bacterium]